MSELFQSVDRIYRNLDGRITRHWISDDLLATFSNNVRQLQIKLEDAKDDRVVTGPLSWFRRLRYVLACTPIDFEHALEHCVPPPLDLAGMIRSASVAYPTAAAWFDEACAGVDAMRSAKAELPPLVAHLASTNGEDASAVVIRYQRHVDCAQRAIKALGAGAAVVFTASGLSGLKTFDRIVICGPASWHPMWLRTAPRAPRIEIACHAWINDPLEVAATLGADSATASGLTAQIDSGNDRPVVRVPTIEAHELAPRVDAAALARRVQTVAEDRQVELAILVVLDDQRAVFLSGDEASDVLAIELASGIPEAVHVPARRLREGSFVVLRTRGSADYVRDVADSILGPRAIEARRLQSEWKSRLFERMRLRGTRAVVQQLRGVGIAHASIANVERWASERGIALAEQSDFAKLLEWLALTSRIELMWTNIQLLRRTHMSAGATIRDQLEAVVRQVDVESLRGRGRMDFTLDVAGAGILTAFRVLRITDGSHEIPSTQIGKPFEFDD